MSTISLRELIIETICHSGYGVRSENEGSLEETAADLGVLPETLLEARTRRKVRGIEAGVERGVGKQGSYSYRYHTYSVGLPEEGLFLWEEYSKKRGIDSTTLVRSVIHSYLRSSYEPSINGKRFSVGGVCYKGTHRYKKVNITYAAKMVLNIRAAALRVTASALVRALLIETIEGKICRPGSFDLVSRSQMFSDIETYWAPNGAAGVPKNIRFEGQAPRERLVESYGHEEM